MDTLELNLNIKRNFFFFFKFSLDRKKIFLLKMETI